MKLLERQSLCTLSFFIVHEFFEWSPIERFDLSALSKVRKEWHGPTLGVFDQTYCGTCTGEPGFEMASSICYG